MKTTLLLLLAALSIASAKQESRQWTDTQGRSIYGTLTAKTDKSATILLANGKKVEIPLEKLDPPANLYIKEADLTPEVNDADLISTRVSASGNGTKTIELTARAGNKDMLVVATSGTRTYVRATVPKGTTKTYSFRCGEKYQVTGSVEGLVLDSEDEGRKTGISRILAP